MGDRRGLSSLRRKSSKPQYDIIGGAGMARRTEAYSARAKGRIHGTEIPEPLRSLIFCIPDGRTLAPFSTR
jgi:hypothetical protein